MCILNRYRKRTLLLMLSLAFMAVAGCRQDASEKMEKEQEEAAVLTIQAVKPNLQRWPESLVVNGPIKAWEDMIVSPETGGLRIAQLSIEVGAQVKRGDLLVQLADESVQAEVRKQQATVAEARASLEQARSNNRRAKAISRSGAFSDQKMEEYRINEATASASLLSAQADLDSANLKLSQTKIFATDDAVVASKSGILGDVVSTGTELYRLIRQGKLEWKPEVDARQLSSVHKGQRADIRLPDGERVEGVVRLVGPVMNEDTGRAVVYVSLKPNSAAHVGMFVSGNIELGESVALTLPQTAIVMRDGRSYIWLLNNDSRVVSRVVVTGRRIGERIEVKSGLLQGEQVVAQGGAFLSEGAKVTVSSGEIASGKTKQQDSVQ
ncbi:efflux RND transporter periplasmic adaptor subunit [Pectobacterium carotovorum subsp. carotovorum]|nr:efflux RND transporter periplasmic adaptor subunit [Pectobacterium carotovorum subsp. carotovorum]